MKDTEKALIKLNKKRRRREIWMRIMSVLMCLTVFVTTYALILPAVTLDTNEASLPSINWGDPGWDDAEKTPEGFSVSVDVVKDSIYTLQVSYDNGLTWNAVTDFVSAKMSASQTDYKVFAESEALDTLIKESAIDTKYRVQGKGKTTVNTKSYTIADILEDVKPGFAAWLEGDWVECFDGLAPETTDELFNAFDVYYSLCTATISCTVTDPAVISAIPSSDGNYTYVWYYYDEAEAEWTEVTGETGPTITDNSLLPEYGAYMKCKIYDEEGNYQSTSPVEFVNPRVYDFTEAIGIINTGLGLQTHKENGSAYDLSINGSIFNDVFYYTQSAANPDVPFFDAASYRYLLCKTYVRAKDLGASDDDALAEVSMIWNRYLYDLFDPDATQMGDQGGTGYPTAGTYGDQTLSWPKSENSSFHGNIKPVINGLNWDFMLDGVDYSNFISNMSKYATADAPGDSNSDRKYNIDIVADGQAKARAPLALVFQIQTSWQMFDLLHADAKNKDGATQVGSLGNIDAVATLYDIKYGILDFLNYMEEAYPGNNIVLGVTEVRHTVSDSMLNGTDGNGNGLYVTNDIDVLRQALYNWDIFGNCEHVHYNTDAIEAAVKNLVSNLAAWKDFYGVDIPYEDIRKVGVVIGGATENSNAQNGYGNMVTWSAFSAAGFNSVYGIRTDVGTPLNSDNVLSWLDIKANSGAPYKDGTGTGFTKKFIATSRSDIAEALEEIANREFRTGGIEITAIDKYVENTYINDVVKPEFEFDYDKPVTASILNKDGSKMYDVVVNLSEDGSYTVTQIRYGDKGAVLETNDLTDKAELTVIPGENLGDGVKSRLVLTIPQEQTIHLELSSGPEDKIVTVDSSLTITEYNDKTTEVRYVYDVLYNTKKAELNFGIRAREDYLGSNNVYTNEDLAYSGYSMPETDLSEGYTVYCYDTPEVNVPLDFATVNGGSVIIPAGTTYDLEKLDNGVIPADILDRLNKGYTQINGTLKYEWIQPDGTVVNVGGVHYTDGTADSAQPDLTDPYLFSEAGDYIGELRLTFIPDDVVDNGNFHDKVTLEKVNQKRHSGYVYIKVVDRDATATLVLQKLWAGPAAVDRISFKLKNQNGEYYTGSGSTPVVYTLSAANGWKLEINDLPALVGGIVQEYTAEEIPIPGYESAVTSDVTTAYTYAGTMNVSFTPSYATNGAQYIRVTYVYNGTEYVKLLPSNDSPAAVSITAGSKYSFLIEDLPTDENGNCYPGYIKRIDYANSADPTDESSYISYISSDFDPYSCETGQVGYLNLTVTPASKLGKGKSFVVNYTDNHGNSGSVTASLGSDIASGSTYSMVLGAVPVSEYPYEITSITYNGAAVSGTSSLSLSVYKPSFTFTSPGVKIGRGQTIQAVAEDENGVQYALTIPVTADIPAGTRITLDANEYLPEGRYSIVSLKWSSYQMQNPTMSLKSFYRLKTTMLSPDNIPAGSTVTVYYTEDGAEKSFTAQTAEAVSAGEYLTLWVPDILSGDGSAEYEITRVTRNKTVSGKTVAIPFYQPLTSETELYSYATGVSSSTEIQIKNTLNVSLPATGGAGMKAFILTGALMMLGALSGFIIKRKYEAEHASGSGSSRL